MQNVRTFPRTTWTGFDRPTAQSQQFSKATANAPAPVSSSDLTPHAPNPPWNPNAQSGKPVAQPAPPSSPSKKSALAPPPSSTKDTVSPIPTNLPPTTPPHKSLTKPSSTNGLVKRSAYSSASALANGRAVLSTHNQNGGKASPAAWGPSPKPSVNSSPRSKAARRRTRRCCRCTCPDETSRPSTTSA